MITINTTTKEQELKNVIELIKQADSGGWVNIINPTYDELEKIFKILGIGDEKVEHSLDEHEMSRIEKENGNVIIYIRVPLNSDFDISTTPITIIINNNNVISVSIKENRVIDNLVAQTADAQIFHASRFLVSIFYEAISRFEKHVEAISKRVIIKKGNLRNLKNDDIENLVETEEDISEFISSLVPNINVCEKILSGKFIKLTQEEQDFIQDILIDAKQLLELCKIEVKKIVNIREAYSMIITNKLNQTIKFLAAITVILTIPTIVSSIFGMNVNLPIADNPLAFVYVILTIIFVCIGLAAVFAWRRWL